jgi:hypothetical protein
MLSGELPFPSTAFSRHPDSLATAEDRSRFDSMTLTARDMPRYCFAASGPNQSFFVFDTDVLGIPFDNREDLK